jgi:hypothetical protein
MARKGEKEATEGGVVLDGIGRLGWTYGKPSSLFAAMEAMLLYLGYREIDYTWLMGVSGAAFHMRWHPPWDGAAGSIDDPLYIDHAFAAVGRAYWYSVDQPIDLWAEVTRSLDAGRPVLVEGLIGRREYGLIAAYDDARQQVYGRAAVQDAPDYLPADKSLAAMEKLVFVGAAGAAPDRAACELASLGTAISVLRGAARPWLGGQVRGMPAWAAWARALRDDAALEARLQVERTVDLVGVNESLYTAVSGARREAATYLRRIGPRLPRAALRDAVTRAAAAFAEVVATLDGRSSLLGEEAGAEVLIVDRVQRAAWAGLVEKAAKYDQAGLLALEQGWHDSGAAEGRPTEDAGG